MSNPVKQSIKDQQRAERQARRDADRTLRRARYACFWTRPFGHAWQRVCEPHVMHRCAACPATQGYPSDL